MSEAKKIEVGTTRIRTAFQDGVENYIPTAGGHELQEEGGVTDVSLENLKELVELIGSTPVLLEVGPNQGVLVSWNGVGADAYLATGFSIGYRGTGPHGLAKFCEVCGWGDRLELLQEIAALPTEFRGVLFPRKARV